MTGTTTPESGYLLRGTVIEGGLTDPIPDGAVVVVGDEIAWVGPASSLPEQWQASELAVIERPGATVMPGLVDAHVHIAFGEARSEEELAFYTPPEYRSLRAVWNARKVLRAGVTSAFDAATTFNVGAAVRDAIDAGMFEGPRFSVAGRQITSHQGLEDAFPSWNPFPPGQAGVLVKSRDEIVEQVRLQVKDGVDTIKVSGSNDSAVSDEPLDGGAFTEEEFKLIADEAHRLNRTVTVHARSKESTLWCARSGYDWIMHASFIDDEGIEACLKNGVSLCPTLTLLVNIIDSSVGSAGASIIDVFKREVEAASENLSRAYRAGVPLMCGSESGWSLVPYGQWHAKELQIMVDLLGLSPLEAIHAATQAASRALPRLTGKIGKLEAGRYADILVVDGDPLADISLLQKPSAIVHVMKSGRMIDTKTPIEPRRVWSWEKHKTYLPGKYVYDESTGAGKVV